MPFSSCKKEEPTIISVDFGEGKYKEPFRGFLSSHPQWLVATLDWPVLRSLRPDTLVLTKTIEIEFNEDAVRSHSDAIIQIVDENSNRLKGVKVYCNDLPVGKEGFRIISSTEPQLVKIAYKIDPSKKECTETGFFVVSGTELDEVNNVKLYSDSPQSVADWIFTQKIGCPWLLWLLWLIMALIILAIAVLLVWLIIKAISGLFKVITGMKHPIGANNQVAGDKKPKPQKKKEKQNNKEEEKRLPFFLPWVGKDYEHSMFDKRILVLGESHYCGTGCHDCGSSRHDDCSDFTTRRVEDYLNNANERERWMNTYLKFERSLVGYETTYENRQQIWDNISFYNFLQVAMGGPRLAGTLEQYQEAVESFNKVLEQLQPDVLIVWGKRLWNVLPARWREGESVIVDGYQVQNGYFSLNSGKQVCTFCVYHPSSGYDWSYWHKVIKRFL